MLFTQADLMINYAALTGKGQMKMKKKKFECWMAITSNCIIKEHLSIFIIGNCIDLSFSLYLIRKTRLRFKISFSR